jgi:hypothetical protein
MFDSKRISADEAEAAYRKMLEDGSRLPEQEIKKQLKLFRR